jgi:outer membrane protein OmpU
MKKVLFASTALAGLAIGGMASAQGIELFGDARLGLGYNIFNDGDLILDADGDTPDDLRVVSRVRFGVNMTGETDSGITFGATIRADRAIEGAGDVRNPGIGGDRDDEGQTEGSVFVSGAWGTLTTGDTNGADEQWVGDLNEVGLTCLGCQNETFFFSNAGDFGGGGDVAAVEERPTIRYDYDFAGFGVSLSSNRDLTDIGVGAGYSGDFGGGSFTAGLGYYDFDGFGVDNPELGVGLGNEFEGHQWSAALGGEFGMFNGKLIYTQAEVDNVTLDTDGEVGQAGIGLGAGFDAWSVDAYYFQIVKGDGIFDDIDGLQSYGLGATYDLGGGARIEGGLASVWSIDEADDGFVVADFGIGMAF